MDTASPSPEGIKFDGQKAEGNARQHVGHHIGHNIYNNTYNNHYTPSPSPQPSDATLSLQERNEQLLSAATDGLVWRVHALIDKGANIDFAGAHGLTPLHCAAYRGYENCVAAILLKGADINACSDYGTALCLAAAKGHTGVVRKLLGERAKPDAPASGFGSALHVASFLGLTKIVKALLDRGANPAIFQIVRGDPLRMLEMESLKVPLPGEKESIMPRQHIHRSCQPLLLAVDRRHGEVVDLLMKHGASATDYHDILIRRPPEVLLPSKPVKVNAVNYASSRKETSSIFERLKRDLKRVHVLVIGMEGAKESYLGALRQQSWEKPIGLSLAGKTLDVFKLGHDGAWYAIVDTPNFTGDSFNDGNVLWDLNTWLAAAHRQNLGWDFNGVVFVNSVASHVDQKKAIGVAEVVANLLGEDALKNTVVVTTGWDTMIEPRQIETATAREKILTDPFTSRGARSMQFNSTKQTGLGILQQMKNKVPTVFQIQREIVHESKKFQDTAAAQAFTRIL